MKKWKLSKGAREVIEKMGNVVTVLIPWPLGFGKYGSNKTSDASIDRWVEKNLDLSGLDVISIIPGQVDIGSGGSGPGGIGPSIARIGRGVKTVPVIHVSVIKSGVPRPSSLSGRKYWAVGGKLPNASKRSVAETFTRKNGVWRMEIIEEKISEIREIVEALKKET